MADKPLTRHEGPLTFLQRAVNDLFSDFGRTFEERDWLTNSLAVKVDMGEDNEAYHVTAELPGLAREDVDVHLNHDLLTIRGKKERKRDEQKQDYHFTERTFGSFQRTVRFLHPIQADKVMARFENGVLHVDLPKVPGGPQARRIEVKG